MGLERLFVFLELGKEWPEIAKQRVIACVGGG